MDEPLAVAREFAGSTLFPQIDPSRGPPEEDGMPPTRLPLQRIRFGTTLVDVAAYESLPPTDALALLSGEDNTGMMLWPGSMVAAAVALRWRAASARRDFFLELGCGCGLVSAALAATGTPLVIATDGNAECVELAVENMRRNERQEASTEVPCVTRRAFGVSYLWGDALPPSIEDALCAAAGEVTIVAGDVLYAASAVAPLTAALSRIAAACPRNVALHFLLGFFPRTWTDTEAATLLASLEEALRAAGWIVTTRIADAGAALAVANGTLIVFQWVSPDA